MSKSTLAFYTFDGLALSVNLNFFLVIFTDWCAVYYNETLDNSTKYDRIYVNYIQLYDMDMSPFEFPDWQDYDTVNDFFIRSLRPGSRPISSPEDLTVFVTPAECRILVLPMLPIDFSVILKDNNYLLSDLVGSRWGPTFVNGTMIIARLAPQDYHRYHAPMNGTVIDRIQMDGPIFSVNGAVFFIFLKI